MEPKKEGKLPKSYSNNFTILVTQLLNETQSQFECMTAKE